MWSRTKTTGKVGFDKLYGWVDKLGPPVNKLSNKLGSEAFWPTTLDKESDKAARILQSFCRDGFYQEDTLKTADAPKSKQKVLQKVPPEVIYNAKGLAIFTTMRTGLWVSGAGGSGVLIARKPDGSWSPPSGIMTQTMGLGLLVGIDIYDCLLVINTQEALDAFSQLRCTLGTDISAVAGPIGIGAHLETEVHKRQAPIFTYIKSRGFYIGVQIDGTIVIERTDENERFYNERIPVADILAGKVRHPPFETRALLETIKAAQGDADVDERLLPLEPAPSDFEIVQDKPLFGVPTKEDPDPYGVLALEKEGFEIREAGTHRRPSSEQFEFNPSPLSPIYSAFSRKSIDGRTPSRKSSIHSSWRISALSAAERPPSKSSEPSRMTDMSTQTDFEEPSSPVSRRSSSTNSRAKMGEIPENKSTDDVSEPIINGSVSANGDISVSRSSYHERRASASASSVQRNSLRDTMAYPDPPRTASVPAIPYRQSVDLAYADEEPEVAIVQAVRRSPAPQFISRAGIGARLVTVTKPTPPKLPPRNPIRDRKRPLVVDASPVTPSEAEGSTISPTVTETEDRKSMSPHRGSGSSDLGRRSSATSFDSISSGEQMSAVSERVAKMGLRSDSANEERKKVDASSAAMPGAFATAEADEFHSLPVTPDGDVRPWSEGGKQGTYLAYRT
ncbi:hypothetical protein W97_06356 [Coniosporium apollinis CBS 100218]|uniref:Ysc84 actin-binding domain-containing protein n=1 Tax=Coniosporium apollinis (strain CBS 100218) TaxID=1168221 RepID=R7YZ51_CONA1|nr:uncharacterized protein W97_06356 [Coniosporium apollinis CBS 100218]EON67103.1 hypothetical protein W97_06356 [Coniosporium apollinis CBS 100218]